MERREFLSTVGVVVTASAAGCASSDGTPTRSGETTTASTTTSNATTTRSVEGPRQGDDLPEDDDPSDGYPPEFETRPDEREFADTYFGTVMQDGEDVPSASIDVCYYWYARGEARFVDARGAGQYDSQHVFGAVNSPATEGDGDDPVEGWPKDDRIVCYCGCPHHLSSIRAADLIGRGYQDVYIIDEGYWNWNTRNYPMAGEDVGERPNVITIAGVTDAAYAGETAWAIHEPSEQVEATPIGTDGRYSMELKFRGMTESTPIRVRTPAYDVRGPLGELSDGVVTRSGSY